MEMLLHDPATGLDLESQKKKGSAPKLPLYKVAKLTTNLIFHS